MLADQMNNASLHNEMVDYWTELFVNRPPGRDNTGIYYKFKARYPEANAFAFIDVTRDAESRAEGALIEQEAIEKVLNRITSILGPINNNPRFESDLKDLAAEGHSEAKAALDDYQLVSPLIGYDKGRYLPTS